MGSFLIAAAALKTPTRNGYSAQGVNLNFYVLGTVISTRTLHKLRTRVGVVRVKAARQLLSNRYGQIHFAQVPERVSTKSFVVLSIGDSRVENLMSRIT